MNTLLARAGGATVKGSKQRQQCGRGFLQVGHAVRRVLEPLTSGAEVFVALAATMSPIPCNIIYFFMIEKSVTYTKHLHKAHDLRMIGNKFSRKR